MKRNLFNISFLLIFFIGALLVLSYPVYTVIEYQHKETYTGTITDKYNKRSDESDNFYIVLDNKTVIENKDLVFKGYFDSADKQAQLKVGDKVKVKTIGYRIPILSTYPKLYEIERMN
ncbi:transcriptional activator [Staphylococcus phage PALS_1]|nr:transcriptional activator [Staphylococcus phage PALS_1]